jgi:hypothetical protein
MTALTRSLRRRRWYAHTLAPNVWRPAWIAGVALMLWLCMAASHAWAQAAIDIQALSDWLNTIAWYGLVPVLRIIGVVLLITGFAGLGSEVRGSKGAGLALMIAGGLALLAPEIANAIYTHTHVDAAWATNGSGGAGP